jgi:HSP20 family protein
MERPSDGLLAPALDLYTTPDGIVARLALPGVKAEDIDVTVGDDLVTISGFVDDEEATIGAGSVHHELRHGPFARSFWLPTTVNASAATATLEDGLLTLRLPRAGEAQSTPVRIPVG